VVMHADVEAGSLPAVEPDAQCAAAIDLARTAITTSLDDIGRDPGVPTDHVGAHVRVTAEVEGSATHHFECLSPGYRGWHWVVLLLRGEATPSVADVVLLPGESALRPPAWVPWKDRVEAGDLGPGDLLPTTPDDPRLIPGYTGEGDPDVLDADAVLEIAWELGLDRARVLSPEGRDDALMRWYDGDTGPTSAMARQAPDSCVSCGFLMTIRGLAGQSFGVCANEHSPADGRIVALDFGCGAHSEVVEPEVAPVDVVGMAIDEIAYDDLPLERATTTQDVPEAEESEADTGGTDLDDAIEAAAGEPDVDADESADEADDEDAQP
jgi:hypothetical protein